MFQVRQEDVYNNYHDHGNRILCTKLWYIITSHVDRQPFHLWLIAVAATNFLPLANEVAGRQCFQMWLSVCLSINDRETHVTITHNALALSVKGPLPFRHWTSWDSLLFRHTYIGPHGTPAANHIWWSRLVLNMNNIEFVKILSKCNDRILKHSPSSV